MSKAITTHYKGKFQAETASPLTDNLIKTNPSRFSPVDLLTTAYGSCLLGTMDWIAQQNNFEVPASRSEINYEMNEQNSGIGAINIKVYLANDYPQDQREIIENAAKQYCHVGNSLNADIKKTFEFNYNQTIV